MEELSTAKTRHETAHDDHERAHAEHKTNLDSKEHHLEERLKALHQKKREAAEANGNIDAADDDLVEVNAGGQIISAKRSTFTQLKGTRLEALLSGRWDKTLQRDVSGRIFLDVDPVGFRAIVDYLNEMVISSAENPPAFSSADDEHKQTLMHQLELFGILDKTVAQLPDSNIVKDVDKTTQLRDWLKEDDCDGELSLLYRSSRDGSTVADFCHNCENQGCTLTVIETTNGFVLGGYSNTPWRDSAGYTTANKAFLFVLSGSDIVSPHKMKLKDTNDPHAVYHSSNVSCCPRFGYVGPDLCVDRRQGLTVNLQFGHTYESCPPGQLTRVQNSRYTIFAIKEMEVFQVIAMTSQMPSATSKQNKTHHKIPQVNPVNIFSKRINEAINARQESLLRAELEILNLEDSFKDEHHFIASFGSGGAVDVVVLNVSGTTMATKRSTLQSVKDSVLAQQFDNSKWTEQGGNVQRVKDWTPDDVSTWVENIHGIPDGVGNSFKENNITGYELLALEKDGLVALGISRPGTWSVIIKEIKRLEKSSQNVVTLVEHSPYCFGKILEFLRRMHLHSNGLAEEPALPTVCDSQKSRFGKVVKYYFPGDSAKIILG